MDETRKSIDNLRDQIEKTQVEGEKHQRLEEIRTLIHLTNEHPDGKHHPTLKAHLEKAIVLFDAEHHELVTAMQGTINSLSSSGV